MLIGFLTFVIISCYFVLFRAISCPLACSIRGLQPFHAFLALTIRAFGFDSFVLRLQFSCRYGFTFVPFGFTSVPFGFTFVPSWLISGLAPPWLFAFRALKLTFASVYFCNLFDQLEFVLLKNRTDDYSYLLRSVLFWLLAIVAVYIN